jgi:hypothetical protein
MSNTFLNEIKLQVISYFVSQSYQLYKKTRSTLINLQCCLRSENIKISKGYHFLWFVCLKKIE